MCGLIGSSGQADKKIITALGCLNEKRGDESAGIGWWEANAPQVSKCAKDPLVAFPFLLAESVEKAVLTGGPIIGHTRQASTGEVCDRNAHPFVMDGILFAHNGIIQNYKDFGAYVVDSQALIHGIKEKNFEKYQGCIALLWIEGGKLKVYRQGNPLFRGRLGETTYFSSEAEFLEIVGCEKVRPVKEGVIYTFENGKIENCERVKVNQPMKFLAASYPVSSYTPEIVIPSGRRKYGGLEDEAFGLCYDCGLSSTRGSFYCYRCNRKRTVA